jgi:hypothetical protein
VAPKWANGVKSLNVFSDIVFGQPARLSDDHLGATREVGGSRRRSCETSASRRMHRPGWPNDETKRVRFGSQGRWNPGRIPCALDHSSVWMNRHTCDP